MENGGLRGWRMRMDPLHPPSLILILKFPQHPTPSPFLFVFLREKVWVNTHGRFIDSFFELTADPPLSLNQQPIRLFLRMHSQFTSFFEFTANSPLSSNLQISVYSAPAVPATPAPPAPSSSSIPSSTNTSSRFSIPSTSTPSSTPITLRPRRKSLF